MARNTHHNNAKKVSSDRKAYERALDKIARTMAVTAYNFFLDSFQRQGWLDQNLQSWPERGRLASRDTGRSILTDTGALKGSLQISKQKWPTIKVVSAGVAYARMHNDGQTVEVPVTPQMRKYFWAKYMETGFPEYRWMATTKKNSFTIDMPQRKFMGNSRTLTKQLTKEVKTTIRRHLRKT